MKRKIYNELIDWKKNDIKKPLMVIGARQIGKTYIIKKFCESEFKNYIYINLFEHSEIVKIFKEEISTYGIIGASLVIVGIIVMNWKH